MLGGHHINLQANSHGAFSQFWNTMEREGGTAHHKENNSSFSLQCKYKGRERRTYKGRIDLGEEMLHTSHLSIPPPENGLRQFLFFS